MVGCCSAPGSGEPGFSSGLLREMADESLTLVAPAAVLRTYSIPEGVTVLTVADFIEMVSSRDIT